MFKHRRSSCQICPLSSHFDVLPLQTVLCLNTSLTVFLSGLSRKGIPEAELYSAATAVVSAELLKLIMCSLLLATAERGNNYNEGIFFCFGDIFCPYFTGFLKAWQTFTHEVLGKPAEGVKLVVPAAIYAFQNNILYQALTYLDSVTYQVTYQLKILTTALFSVLVLHRALHPRQWVALVMLTVGVTIVQV